MPEDDDLNIPELDEEFFKNAVVGKHYKEYRRSSNVVRIAMTCIMSFRMKQL